MAIVIGVGVLLAAGTATLIEKETSPPSIDDSFWEDLSPENLKKAPPVLIVRATHFPESSGMATSVFEDRAVGRNVGLSELLEAAYGLPFTRMVLPPEFEGPAQMRFDFLVTITNHPREEFQSEIAKQFGLIVRREIRAADVLVLRVTNPDAPGLKNNNDTNAYPLANHVRVMSGFFGKPVLDQTGLTGRYGFSPQLPRHGLEAGREAYKKALLEQLGLELVPTNMPIEMLVVEKVKQL